MAGRDYYPLANPHFTTCAKKDQENWTLVGTLCKTKSPWPFSGLHDDSASTIFARTDNATLVPMCFCHPYLPRFSSTKTPRIFRRSTRFTVLATAGTARDIVIPGTAVPHSTFESTISAPPLSSTSPPTVLSLQHDGPNLLSPAESNLILDDVLPTVTAARASSGPTSAPDLSAAAEDDVNPKSSSLNGKDTLDPPSVNISIHANTMPTLDRPPSLLSVTDSDIAIAGPSFKC
ncbi:hypothetical protein EDB86DRAFT_3104692 [Lactarius hatsudake]|nr:hypothetical protein EDB86DRAFT_3104692 [Lactarius hatsudake]